jgi:hypothetical protein
LGKVQGEGEENGGVSAVVDLRTADVTVKKFRPVQNPNKKKK